MRGTLRGLSLLAMAVMATPAIPAPPAPPPLDAYGDLPGIEQVAISSDGKGLAILGRHEGQRKLIVLDGDRHVRAMIPAGNAKLRDLNWAGNDTVLITTSVTETLGPLFAASKAEVFGVLVVPLDGKAPWLVFNRSQDMAKVIFGVYGVRNTNGKPEVYVSGLELAKSSTGRDLIGSNTALVAIDIGRQETRTIARVTADGHRRDWLVDAAGRASASIDISTQAGRWEIRNGQGTTLASGVDVTADVGLVAFGPDGSSVIYWKEDDSTGESRLFEVPLAGGPSKEFLPDVTIKDYHIDPASSRLLGYTEEGAHAQPHFFNPAQQSVVSRVARAFPNREVTLVQWTPGFSHMLVRTSGNEDSGSWFLVDVARKAADPVGSERPLILPELVGPISTVSYKASDGLEMDGILTLPPGREAKGLPVVILPHGGPTAHDSPSFDWWAQAFASRGYAVFQPNFRGSTNRDDAFRRAGYGQWGRKMQTDLSDGLAELARQGIVDPRRACIVGASYGGFAALAGVTLQHGLYRCAVAVAPISDLQQHYDKLTHDRGDRQTVWRGLQESLGNPSGFDAVSPRQHAGQADAPILLIHGKDDTVVQFSQSERMASALRAAGKPYEFVVLREEDHWLSRAATRKQMLEAAVGFVSRHNPAD